MCLKMAEALRTARKMTNTLLKRFIFVENPNGMVARQLVPISSRQIEAGKKQQQPVYAP
jgi:hypothetical protein